MRVEYIYIYRFERQDISTKIQFFLSLCSSFKKNISISLLTVYYNIRSRFTREDKEDFSVQLYVIL